MEKLLSAIPTHLKAGHVALKMSDRSPLTAIHQASLPSADGRRRQDVEGQRRESSGVCSRLPPCQARLETPVFLPLRPRQPGRCASPCLQSPLLFCVRSHLLVSLCLISSRSSLESSPSPAGHARGGWSRWERGQRPPSLPGRVSGTPPLSGVVFMCMLYL